VPIIAVHIDHGLHEDSASWSEHCNAFATSLGIEYRSRNVTVQLESGQGPEASAREARYTALHDEIEHGDWLLSAHHREDHAETLLLNLVRGSGPAGLAGIGAIRRFGRPMQKPTICTGLKTHRIQTDASTAISCATISCHG
jgi:tRNA(Ile)-lysidine synthase